MSSEIKNCTGCGVLLQDENVLQEGYTTSIDNDICQRCFRMKNYGEYQVVTKSNEEYLKILKEDINNACDNLIKRANELGGYDNISVIIMANP